ncbi:MAG: CHRD domain-containing protein [Acetobacteraceae bacterium]
MLTAAAVSFLSISAAQADTVTFHATMNGATEVPAKTTNGKGTVTATLDTATKVLTYTVEFSGLTGPATMGHFHGPAVAGANAGVLVPFPSPVTSPIHATAKLTDAEITDLETGKVYANIHTAANPGGEIRGQMVK